jgi:hypothetical protein
MLSGKDTTNISELKNFLIHCKPEPKNFGHNLKMTGCNVLHLCVICTILDSMKATDCFPLRGRNDRDQAWGKGEEQAAGHPSRFREQMQPAACSSPPAINGAPSLRTE